MIKYKKYFKKIKKDSRGNKIYISLPEWLAKSAKSAHIIPNLAIKKNKWKMCYLIYFIMIQISLWDHFIFLQK